MSSRNEQFLQLHHDAIMDNEFINYISNKFNETELELLYNINSNCCKYLLDLYWSYEQNVRYNNENNYIEDIILEVKNSFNQLESDNESFQTNSYDGYSSDNE